mmetsp:Transcript_57160/g.99974  ORF Transcript_57160/g.99974 Transcript_57160/m.99974 type:complete len:263 (+) Transcript_57160:89-877(+)
MAGSKEKISEGTIFLSNFNHYELLATLKETLADRPGTLRELVEWAQGSAPDNGAGYHGKDGWGKDAGGKGFYGKGKDGYGKDGYGKDGYGKDGYGKGWGGEWAGSWDSWGPPAWSDWGSPPPYWEEVPAGSMWKGKGKGPDWHHSPAPFKEITGRTTRTLNPEGPPPVSKVEIEGVTDGTRYNGTVKRFTPGKFGFIETAAGELEQLGQNYQDVYVHWNQLGDFSVGDEISFEVVVNEKGGVKAVNLGPPHQAKSRKRHREP